MGIAGTALGILKVFRLGIANRGGSNQGTFCFLMFGRSVLLGLFSIFCIFCIFCHRVSLFFSLIKRRFVFTQRKHEEIRYTNARVAATKSLGTRLEYPEFRKMTPPSVSSEEVQKEYAFFFPPFFSFFFLLCFLCNFKY